VAHTRPKDVMIEAAALAMLLVGGWFVIGSQSDKTVSIILLALYYAVAGLSFNFLQGALGVFSLAQPVFLMVGGYTDAYLSTQFGISPWLCILIAIGCSAVIALPIGLACVRSGANPTLVALVTLIIAEAAGPIVVSISGLGGGLGILIRSKSGDSWSSMQFLSPDRFAQLLLVLYVLLIAGLAWFKRTRWGYWAVAIRDSPEAASAVGVPVRKLSLVLFVLSSVIVAPAGLIYAQYNLNVTTDLFLSTTALFQVSVVALVGGSMRSWGALAGGLIVVYLTQKAGDLSNGHAGLPDLTFAVLFLIIVLVMPRGISGTWAAVLDWRHRRHEVAFGSIEFVQARSDSADELPDATTAEDASSSLGQVG
jgi:branched-chain amino acid transport system permease protein